MDPLEPLIIALHSEGRLRVWSLVISVFGDLVQHRGGQISTTRLRAVLGRIGVEQNALRTALSRLTGDGWVLRDRVGRASLYRLSPQGAARFAPATTLIYAPPRQTPVARWAAVVTQDGNGAPSVRLCPADEAPGAADALVMGELVQVSPAFRAATLSPDHRAALAALARDIAALASAPPDPLDAAAARVLLVHRWRRLVLRFPEPAAELMPADSPLHDPRRAVAATYERLSPGAEDWLDSDADGLQPMPAATRPASIRFGHGLRA